MLERLEKFEAPRSWTQLVPGAVLIIVAIAILAWLDSTAEPEPQIPQQAVATEKGGRASLAIPFAHPLGCPEEDASGRKLRGTLAVTGERKRRCYYGPVK